MNYQKRITIDPQIMVGKPVIRGTRITVELILEMLGQGITVDQILKEYPHLKKEDIKAAVEFAQQAIKKEKVNIVAQNQRAQL